MGFMLTGVAKKSNPYSPSKKTGGSSGTSQTGGSHLLSFVNGSSEDRGGGS